MDSAKKQLADRLKTANNILVTVSKDPSVDQLAACLGLTLMLNKLSKHSVAVFSGEVPSTIEFLKPEETIEKTTDSLRDFIIALDKDKADKLRYKVEDNVVRIFITPYKTSITQEDLEFSQGDFNVDVVIALGVKQQEDLDQAITDHGRILHDATVASLNTTADGGLGTINWHDPQASSLSELVTELAQLLGDKILDNQIATALLTGIVAETGRFSNDRTSSQTMSASSALMAAGANQQLVATKLEKPPESKPATKPAGQDAKSTEGDKKPAKQDDGALDITHDKSDSSKAKEPEQPEAELPAPQPDSPPPPPPPPSPASNLQPGAKLVTERPTLGSDLTASARPEGLDPVTDPLSMPSAEPSKLMSRSTSKPPSPTPEPAVSDSPKPLTPPPANWTPPTPTPVSAATNQSQTLTDIEKSVHSPHVDANQLDTARDEVSEAFKSGAEPTPTPIQALNAQPLGDKLHTQPAVTPNPVPTPNPLPEPNPMMPLGQPSPESATTSPQSSPSPDSLSPTPGVSDPNSPPPVPPPIPFQFGNNQTPPNQPPPAQ